MLHNGILGTVFMVFEGCGAFLYKIWRGWRAFCTFLARFRLDLGIMKTVVSVGASFPSTWDRKSIYFQPVLCPSGPWQTTIFIWNRKNKPISIECTCTKNILKFRPGNILNDRVFLYFWRSIVIDEELKVVIWLEPVGGGACCVPCLPLRTQ